MKLLYVSLVFLTACVAMSTPAPKREGEEVKCASISNGPVTEVCRYPAGVVCFGGDKGLSCIQLLPNAGGIQ